jgi:glycosyltransferase involved in cell wall biosynthesis
MAVHAQQSPAYLEQALESLKRQTWPASELVIVADGALPAELQRVIDAFSTTLPLKILGWKDNRGLGAAMRTGLAACTQALVARMDSDDIILEHRFEKQLRHLDETGADVCGSSALALREDGAMAPPRKVPLTHAQIMNVLWACPFIHGSVMYRRDQILAAGSYDARLRRRQDYDLWFRCAEAGLRFSNIAEPLLIYRERVPRPLGHRVAQAWRQGQLGSANSRRLGLPVWKQLACYYPLLRSVSPTFLRSALETMESAADPRRRH